MKLNIAEMKTLAGLDPEITQFYVNLYDVSLCKTKEEIGKFDTLTQAKQAIIQYAKTNQIVPDVVKESDLIDIAEISPGVWEMGSDEVSFLIKKGTFATCNDLR